MPIGKSNGAVADQGTAVRTVITPVQPAEPTNGKYIDANDAKSRRILRQGIVQAVVQSPIVAGLSFATEAEAVALIKRVSTELINFVDNQ